MRILNLGNTTTTIRFGSLDDAREILSPSADLVVCDENTSVYAGPLSLPTLTIASGELNKNWASIESILHAALEHKLTRASEIIGVGGGVICDMCGFAASVYMRGCGIVLVPTTLLAMIDASVGGKTGIDFEGYKNFVGTFYPAKCIFIAVEVLETLSRREYLSGLAEAIKHGMLGDAELLDIVESDRDRVTARERDVVERIVSGSLDVKGGIVAKDLTENGVRAHLNLGHTFGHALETYTSFRRFTHGEAVAWGIGKALKLGIRLGLTDVAYASRVWNLLEAYGYELVDVPTEPDVVLEVMKSDKKRRTERLRCIVQRKQGITEIVEPEDSLISEVISDESRL